jgi:glycosyltransferase involved in cell wall biosynthesis
MKTLCFDWGISDHYGWGVYGLNLWVYGSLSQKFRIQPVNKPNFLYPLDPLTQQFVASLAPAPLGGPITLKAGDIMLTGLGNQIRPRQYPALVNAGVIFFEANPLGAQDIEHLKTYDFIVAGSGWNASVLARWGVKTQTVIQGIDRDLFLPRPKKYLRDRFVVLSGGKLEFRKGQDILVKAFARFAQSRPEALLVTAWRSPWEKKIAASINQSGLCQPITPQDDMGRAIAQWLADNGIAAHQTLNLGATAQRLMPEVFREVDLAVFPNRCEGGTNLVAMEAMASGLTCVLSRNTGHLDLIRGNNCLVLSSQQPVAQQATEGWGESSVDELVAHMEAAYAGKSAINPQDAAASMAEFSWADSIARLQNLFL